jgi:hypothetical protein
MKIEAVDSGALAQPGTDFFLREERETGQRC